MARGTGSLVIRLDFTVGTFTNNNGIVHHNAEHHNKGKQTHDINGHAAKGHKPKCPGKADWDAQNHPKGNLEIEKHTQHQSNQKTSHQQVFGHHSKTAIQIVGLVIKHRNFDALRQAARFFLNILVSSFADIQKVLAL